MYAYKMKDLRFNVHGGLRFDVQGNRTTILNLQNHWRIKLFCSLSHFSKILLWLWHVKNCIEFGTLRNNKALGGESNEGHKVSKDNANVKCRNRRHRKPPWHFVGPRLWRKHLHVQVPMPWCLSLEQVEPLWSLQVIIHH